MVTFLSYVVIHHSVIGGHACVNTALIIQCDPGSEAGLDPA